MQSLIQMLKEHEIKNIISVDDGWKSSDKLVDKMASQGIDMGISIKDYCDLYAIEVDECESVYVEEFKDELLKNIDDIVTKIPKTYAIIQESLKTELDSSLKTLENILYELDKAVNINIIKGAEFQSCYRDVEGNTLYILDKDMGNGQEHAFLQYIIDITDGRKEYNDLIIVYSSEVSNLLTHDKKLKYLKENETDGKELAILYQFWPLTKIADKNKLMSGIKEMVSKSIYGKALSKMVEMKILSIKTAFEDLLKIDIDNLDDMIIESFIEGGKITDSYELLIDSLIKRSLLQYVSNSDVMSYEKGLLQYEAKRANEILMSKSIDSTSKYNKFRNTSLKNKVVESIRKDVMLFNVADYSINQEYDNPSMGDIYIFTEAIGNKKCAGMLISQECSTIIRKDNYNDRARRNADDFLLLLFDIVEISDETIDDSIIKKLNECIWPIKIDEKICLLKNTKRSMHVSTEVLDLCGLNSDGRANLKFDKTALEYKGLYSQEYYKDFDEVMATKIKDIIDKVKSDNGIKRHDSNIKNMIISLAFGIVFKENFEVRRICKIDEKQTLHIIHEYLNGIGKIGLPVTPNIDVKADE